MVLPYEYFKNLTHITGVTKIKRPKITFYYQVVLR